ncbi:MAG: hypothetical protein H8E66_24245 [Planctomycetes bacterium]|nr:hypothetical protein [Planctomycetota bacterium]
MSQFELPTCVYLVVFPNAESRRYEIAGGLSPMGPSISLFTETFLAERVRDDNHPMGSIMSVSVATQLNAHIDLFESGGFSHVVIDPDPATGADKYHRLTMAELRRSIDQQR